MTKEFDKGIEISYLMAGIQISICFWYLDNALVKEVIQLLKEGNYTPVYELCKSEAELNSGISTDKYDIIIADFDIPSHLRLVAESLHSSIASHIPYIYVVGEKNEERAAETLKQGVWDYLLKSQFIKLVPTVYSSQKYGKVLRNSLKAKAELQKSEENFQSLSDNTPDLIIRFDKQLKHIYVNEAVEHYTGVSRDVFLLKSHREMNVFPIEIIPKIENALKSVFDSGESCELEFGDASFCLEWRIFPEINKKGEVESVLTIGRDMSKERRNQRLQKAVFDISNAVNTTGSLEELYDKIRDYLGTVVDTTNCFLAMFNEENNTLSLPYHVDEVDSYDEFPVGKTLTGYVVKTGKSLLVDAEIEKKLIEQGHIENVGSPMVSWLGVPLEISGQIIGVFVIQSYNKKVKYKQEDVHILEFVSEQIAIAIQRKRQQNSILKNQEKQRRIFESSPDPLIVVDKESKVVDYNTALLKVVNITDEPVKGLPIYYFIDRKDWRKAIRNFSETWEKGFLKNLEFSVKRINGTSFPAEVSTGAIYDELGNPESMVIMFKDIGERKETEKDLREAKEKAEESDRLKTAFLSNMSHEIRTPMNAIVGFSDLLNDPDLPFESRQEFVVQINKGADSLMHLIDDIIDISKIEAGQVKINIQEVNVKSLIDDVYSVFSKLLKDKGADLDFQLLWDCSKEDLIVKTDPFRIKQVLNNLLGNAMKFTDSGHIILSLTMEKDRVKFSVKDSGVGIPEDKQEKIFDRFIQGHVSKQRLYGGTGLGLAISKNLIHLLGGEIGLASVEGIGSEFWFTIPENDRDSIDSKP